MSASSTEGGRTDGGERALLDRIRRFRERPMGPYDADVQAMLMTLRNAPAAGKLALMRLPAARGWTMVRLGGRGRPVTVIGGRWTDVADAEWAVFRARWRELQGWDPEARLGGPHTAARDA